ncbi:MAG: S41 family peptidase [Woeseiaceae bacterium]
MYKSLCSIGAVMLFMASAFDAVAEQTELWRVEMDENRLGPVQFNLRIERSGSDLRGKSTSGLLTFDATLQADDTYKGELRAPESGGQIVFSIDDGVLTGRIDAAEFRGKLQAKQVGTVEKIRDYPSLMESFDAVVAAKIYSPDDLAAPPYQAFRQQLQQTALDANDDLDLLLGFRAAWNNQPFSHFELRRSAMSANEMFAYLDTMRVGFEAATVEMQGDIAILKVRTMMGIDTIEQIQVAFEKIAREQPSTLIVDLRGNGGGAFAVKPLVEHIIDEPQDAGYFLSQVWNRSNNALPTRQQILATDPWNGWSIIAFWHAVQQNGLLRIQFSPAEPNFDGQVFVLLDEQAASATEMAADALSASGLVTIIGQPSAGEMLSQSMFDIGGGFLVSLPVADYYSFKNGRIEGTGVAVDIESDPEQALAVAIQMAE